MKQNKKTTPNVCLQFILMVMRICQLERGLKWTTKIFLAKDKKAQTRNLRAPSAKAVLSSVVGLRWRLR